MSDISEELTETFPSLVVADLRKRLSVNEQRRSLIWRGKRCGS
jgi:hypothetical protein